VYQKIWDCLGNDECVGIFPEGGSHDRTELLPLKAGVCLMALGAMAIHNKPVYIVPCGLQYYRPDQFRSKVIMVFGVPYKIPIELVELYKVKRREAISILLKQVETVTFLFIEYRQLLESVLITAPTYTELNSIILCRMLYVPSHMSISADKELTLNHK